jgi:hypothetical protein
MSVHLSDNQALAMTAWIGLPVDFPILSFKTVGARSGLDQHLVRRTVRAIARKGLLKFARCSWSDDGEMMGAGYEPTTLGWEYLSNLAEPSDRAGERKAA